jgi:hypothetical protein
MASIDFDDLDAWIAEAQAAGERLADEARLSFELLIAKAEADMKAAAPKPRRGERAATIGTKVVRGRRRLVADVGPTAAAFSLVFEEFGSRNRAAAPWARPALDAVWSGWEPFA